MDITRDLGLKNISMDLSSDPAPDPDLERRGIRRHRLVRNAVPVRFVGAGAPGRVRDISIGGGVYVETSQPFDVGTSLKGNFSMPGGHAMSMLGRVVRRGSDGMAIHFRAEVPAQSFLNIFVAVARQAKNKRGLLLTLSLADAEAEKEVELAQHWAAAQADDGEEAHQRFIQACLGVQRLDFALERYRKLNETRGSDPRLEKYIAQIGTILSFTVLAKPVEVERKKTKLTPSMLVVILSLISLLTLWLLMRSKH